MPEYIEKVAAIDFIQENQCKKCSDIGLCGGCAVLTAMKLFQTVPAADVVPVKHGRWLHTPTWWFYCSECGIEPPNESNTRTPYCPNCGAKMDLMDLMDLEETE